MGDQQSELTVVHVVRHGEVHNLEKILYGRAPGFRISARGQQMALAAGDYLAGLTAQPPVSYVAASPLERAQQSARVIADRFGLSVGTDDRLLESQNFFAGRKLRRVDLLRNLHRLYNPFRPSWDEPYRSVAARMTAALHAACDVVNTDVANAAAGSAAWASPDRAARETGEGGAAVLVSHQLPIWILRRHLSKQRLWHSPSRRRCALGSVTSFTFRGRELAGISYHVPAPDLVAAALADDRAARVLR
ncbi:MAG: histidine phosphatase family protein [Mycobacteriales bacterium]